ncbi:MAG: 1-deoxy-D-xylulose-5-phosphate synthase [Hornefia sp.]|nr:1-deoxy-D-xylulose-5-phosphate synthase [Hornefia sp.]
MKKELTDYDFPKDLKTMSCDELELLGISIREFLLKSLSKTGGHLASNLGIVELSLAIHKVFDSPKDKIIWDVGHQSYIHKILTGRASKFDKLRQTGGISGFPKNCESIHDSYDTGHSSTSLSVAAGMAAARDLKGENHDIIAVIGDGAMTGGMAFEALNNIGASKSKVLIILNDNGMSISKNIGGLSNHLNKLRASSQYICAKKNIKSKIKKIPVIGTGLASGISGAKDKVKYALISGGVIFEEMGFTYLGPIDGHNISSMVKILEDSKNISGPVILHVITSKGKGYRNAEIHPNKFHGIGPFDVETGATEKEPGVSFSKIMGDTAIKLAKDNDKIVAITAAMEEATGLGEFGYLYPKRIFDVGIAEQHAVTFAAGLAKAGMKPLVAIYSSFLQRAYDQIIEDVCLQNLDVVFAVDRAGIVGADGETHHGLFDLSYLSAMPNMQILAPSNGIELEAMMKCAFKTCGPVAVRYPRGNCNLCKGNSDFEFTGGNKRLFPGKDGDIWAVGTMLSHALEAREILLQRGILTGVVSVKSVKPIDFSCVNPECKSIFTVEDGTVCGGFGERMKAEFRGNSEITNYGFPDKFIEHGSQRDLFDIYKLNGNGLAERISDYFERKA